MFPMSLADLAEARRREMERKAERGVLVHDARVLRATGRLTSLLAVVRRPSRRSGESVTESFEPGLRPIVSAPVACQMVCPRSVDL